MKLSSHRHPHKQRGTYLPEKCTNRNQNYFFIETRIIRQAPIHQNKLPDNQIYQIYRNSLSNQIYLFIDTGISRQAPDENPNRQQRIKQTHHARRRRHVVNTEGRVDGDQAVWRTDAVGCRPHGDGCCKVTAGAVAYDADPLSR